MARPRTQHEGDSGGTAAAMMRRQQPVDPGSACRASQACSAAREMSPVSSRTSPSASTLSTQERSLLSPACAHAHCSKTTPSQDQLRSSQLSANNSEGRRAGSPLTSQTGGNREATVGHRLHGRCRHGSATGRPGAAGPGCAARHHHPLAHVERPLPRTAVIEQDMLSGTHQHGQPWPTSSTALPPAPIRQAAMTATMPAVATRHRGHATASQPAPASRARRACPALRSGRCGGWLPGLGQARQQAKRTKQQVQRNASGAKQPLAQPGHPRQQAPARAGALPAVRSKAPPAGWPALRSGSTAVPAPAAASPAPAPSPLRPPQAAHQRQRPRRPANSQSSRATARNDSQNPACRLASGSTSKTSTSVASSGVSKAQVAETQAPDQRQADHQAGAPHRDLETRHQPVAPGTKQTQGAGTGQPGQAPRPAAQAMQGRHQAIEHPRQQRDMRTGDDHQMHGAGVLEHAPLGRAQPEPSPSTSAARRRRALCVDRQQALAPGIAPGIRPLAGCRRWPAFTVPTAPTRCANSQAS